MRRSRQAVGLAVLLATASIGCDRQSVDGSSALERLVAAIDADDVDAVRAALKVKIDLEPTCDPYEICKPLALAAGRGNLEIVKLLILAGADPNGRNAYGDTAFITADHAVTLAGKTEDDVREIRRYLIEHGTDVNQPNAFAMTPFMGLVPRAMRSLRSLLCDMVQTSMRPLIPRLIQASPDLSAVEIRH